MKKERLLFALILLAVLPSVAWANAGSPLVMDYWINLLIGNTIIGIIEGGLLIWIYRTPKFWSIPLMILANYQSTLFGYIIVSHPPKSLDITFLNVHFWFWVFVAVTFLMTLFTEYFFVFLAFFIKDRKALYAKEIKKGHFLKKITLATILINLITYALLFCWYWLQATCQIYLAPAIVPLDQLGAPAGYEVYYISPDNANVVCMDLAGNEKKRIESPAASSVNHFAKTVEPNGDFCDLQFYWYPGYGEEFKSIIIKEHIPLQAFARLNKESPIEIPQINASENWKFSAIESTRGYIFGGKRDEYGSSFSFPGQIPLIDRSIHFATCIEGNFVIFQMGEDQIYILHPPTKKIALLARGRLPVVVCTKKPSTQEIEASGESKSDTK
ncbi:MAG: hypothetical protein PVH19_14235 [Planctomycetia bacterium]|jgi:hypothetical protein